MKNLHPDHVSQSVILFRDSEYRSIGNLRVLLNHDPVIKDSDTASKTYFIIILTSVLHRKDRRHQRLREHSFLVILSSLSDDNVQ